MQTRPFWRRWGLPQPLQMARPLQTGSALWRGWILLPAPPDIQHPCQHPDQHQPMQQAQRAREYPGDFSPVAIRLKCVSICCVSCSSQGFWAVKFVFCLLRGEEQVNADAVCIVPVLPEATVVWAGEHMDLTCAVCKLLCYPESAHGREQRPRSIPILSTTPGLFPELACTGIALGWHVTVVTCGRTGCHRLHRPSAGEFAGSFGK